MDGLLRLAVPKGRLEESVMSLIDDIGLAPDHRARSYRPGLSDTSLSVKLLKPQNIPALVGIGSADVGFTGADWVRESGARVVEVLDLGFDPVRIVAAAGPGITDMDALRKRPIVVASEYERLTRSFLDDEGIEYTFVRSYGATEVFPPEDADLIVDNVATGRTLRSHGLHVVAEIMTSTTRFIANPAAIEDPRRRERIEALRDLMQSVLYAREHVLVEMNVPEDRLEEVVKALPCMKSPTVSPLYGGGGFAVKAAVARREVASLVLKLRAAGASDILEIDVNKIIP